MPVMPQLAEGKRIEPPVSDPVAPKHSPAATETPEPEEEEPAQQAGFQGFFGTGISG